MGAGGAALPRRCDGADAPSPPTLPLPLVAAAAAAFTGDAKKVASGSFPLCMFARDPSAELADLNFPRFTSNGDIVLAAGVPDGTVGNVRLGVVGELALGATGTTHLPSVLRY
jgi:hypothetical protein